MNQRGKKRAKDGSGQRGFILKVTDLRIEREGVTILDGIEWGLTTGEHWVLLGANGSGKTSLLAALTGYLMPTSGEIELLGHRYGESDWRSLRCQIGLVSSALRQMMPEHEPAWITVASGARAMIDFWGTPSAEEERDARRILRSIGCEIIADRVWAVLSQGERQRVLIARALIGNPRLLILDEPCAGLDPVARERFLAFVDQTICHMAKCSVILVTHHVEEITPAFTHALLLRDGKTMASGPLGEVMSSRMLSSVFGGKIRLIRGHGRYQLRNVV